MTTQKLQKTLQQLATDQKGRSESSRLQEIFDDVEHALKSGVSRQAVLNALHEDGFTMNLRSFDSALYRIRSKIKAQGTVSQTTPQPAPKPAALNQPKRPRVFTHNPKPAEDLLD